MSLLYIIVEFYHGQLPWSDIEDIDEIEQLKEQYNGAKLIGNLPNQFIDFEEHIQSLDYETKPDYQFLVTLVSQAAEDNEIDLNSPFDWEDEINEERKQQMISHVKYNNKVAKITKEIDLTIRKIQKVNKEGSDEQVEHLEKQKVQYQESMQDIQQLKQILNVTNLVKLLKKKYNKFYKEQDELEMKQNSSKTGSSRKLKLHVQSSHIKAVPSFHPVGQMRSNTISPHPQNQSNNRQQPFNNPNSSSHISSQYHHPFIRKRANTIEQFMNTLDSLTGIKSDKDFNPFEINEQQSNPQRRDSFIEQFIDEMKQYQTQIKQQDEQQQQQQSESESESDWDSFVEQMHNYRAGNTLEADKQLIQEQI
ncbi:MAG: hypothetical protein EZS28_046490, partial [Streblomastix strix]